QALSGGEESFSTETSPTTDPTSDSGVSPEPASTVPPKKSPVAPFPTIMDQEIRSYSQRRKYSKPQEGVSLASKAESSSSSSSSSEDEDQNVPVQSLAANDVKDASGEEEEEGQEEEQEEG